MGVQLRPAFAFVGEYLLVTPWPQAAKNLIRSLGTNKAGLFSREDFALTYGHLKGERKGAGTLGLYYVDLRALVGFVVDTLAPVAQFAALPEELPLDPGLLPSAAIFNRHLFGIIASTEKTEHGMYAEYWSPTSVMGGGLILGAAAGAVVGLRTARSMPPPDRVEPEDKPAKEEDDMKPPPPPKPVNPEKTADTRPAKQGER